MAIPIYAGKQATEFLQQLSSSNALAGQQSLIVERVTAMIQRIATGGDTALADICSELGDQPPQHWCVESETISELAAQVSDDIRGVMTRAAERIRRFATAVKTASATEVKVADEAVKAGLRWQPVKRVGCYVPGGRYPLPSTALMTAVTAAVAGVEDIIILSPKIGPELALAAQLAGAKRVALLGGAHGVAALALGTETFPKVDMIVGPGNAYVTEAKRQLQGIIGIDMLAGPSEVAIIADDSANVDWAAMDLLAQAEHDPDARAYLLTNSVSLAETVQQRLPQLAEQYNLPDFVMAALSQSGVLVLETLDDCVEASNQIAPEHLELLVKHPATITEGLTDYGALFIGHGTPVPMGDYVCGPNHTLPTARSARFSGGLNPMVFLRPQTWMTINPVDDNPDAVNEIYDDAATFAGVEGLVAHRESATLRRL
jgi:histidinol dehydrogenase